LNVNLSNNKILEIPEMENENLSEMILLFN
jgi:hypothetical protein